MANVEHDRSADRAGQYESPDPFRRRWDTRRRASGLAFDVIVLRPLSAVALAVGSVFLMASVPFVAPFEGVRPAWSTFVYALYEYTVVRDLGDF